MPDLDFSGLPALTDDINRAHFFGEQIKKRDSRQAITYIERRYRQDLPARILAMANPDPKWAALPLSFSLDNDEKLQKLPTFTGERQQGASMRAVQSREAARALLIVGEITGKSSEVAAAHIRDVRTVATHLRHDRSPLY